MRPSDSLKASLGRLARQYNAAVTPAVASYLSARGLDRAAVDGFLLGEVSDPDPLHAPFLGRLSIPYITPTGIVSMRFRCLLEHDHSSKEVTCPKYLQAEGEPTHLYNVQALHDADTIIGVSEGEIDAISGTLAGIPTVGCPGIENWKPFYYRLFQDFERVIIFGDGDVAGRKFASKLSHAIPGGEAKVLPEGMDVNSFVVEHGEEAFRTFVFE